MTKAVPRKLLQAMLQMFGRSGWSVAMNGSLGVLTRLQATIALSC